MVDVPEADQLYALPLEEFVEARNALAKTLKSEGRAEESAAVRKLTKPTVAGWALNQLARRRADLIEELLSIRADLAGTSSGSEMRTLSARRRSVVTELVGEAERILTEAGHGTGGDTTQKISQTLFAGGSEEDDAVLRAGRLTRELSSGGFEQMFGGLEDLDESEDREPTAAQKKAQAKAQKLEAEAAAAEEMAVQLEEEARAARTAAEEAEGRATKAREKADKARHEADAAWERTS